MTPPGARPPAGVEARNRVERRKAQTRKKLIDAARAMLANDASARASVQEITITAAVGHGSFYNHFFSKSELFEAAQVEPLQVSAIQFSAWSRRPPCGLPAAARPCSRWSRVADRPLGQR
ncbi:MAG: hypothetical protein QOI75_6833 [Pseudonocardiales bacterium]|nr:hypothetical protein [Pseudonocardiales bacterium]